jgi:hypothetical protein
MSRTPPQSAQSAENMDEEGSVSEDSLEDAAIEEDEESNGVAGKKDAKALRWKYLGRAQVFFFGGVR